MCYLRAFVMISLRSADLCQGEVFSFNLCLTFTLGVLLDSVSSTIYISVLLHNLSWMCGLSGERE